VTVGDRRLTLGLSKNAPQFLKAKPRPSAMNHPVTVRAEDREIRCLDFLRGLQGRQRLRVMALGEAQPLRHVQSSRMRVNAVLRTAPLLLRVLDWSAIGDLARQDGGERAG
jgi:hypothetical protein